MKTPALTHYRAPKTLLEELGIADPIDIDIEAIAQHCGATVDYKELEGCAARIVGRGDRAIIAVDSRATLGRRRFSAGHELGHWMRDRGKMAFACTEQLLLTEWSADNAERRANRYATELLLPDFMFVPRAKNRDITFATVSDLKKEFKMSLTATAIRLVELGSFPAIVVCNDAARRRWFFPGPDVPPSMRVKDEPGRDTLAYDLLNGSSSVDSPLDVYADGWIDHPDSSRYGIREDSVRIGPTLVLSLLWWADERQLLDVEDED